MSLVAYVLLGFTIVNGFVFWLNLRRAEALDAVADEMNRDRAKLLEAARVLGTEVRR